VAYRVPEDPDEDPADDVAPRLDGGGGAGKVPPNEDALSFAV
jgi:hypothetical protein